MELKQNRNFEALVGDTFGFVRETGAHFIPTMLRVNFIYLLAVCAVAYLAFTTGYGAMDFMPSMHGFSDFGDFDTVVKQALWVGDNAWALPLIGLLYLLLLVGFVMFSAYTPAYMILYSRYGRVPSASEIFRFLKEKVGRLVIYFLGLLLLSIPVAIVLIPLVVLLIVTIVGILLIPLVLLLLVMMSSLILYAYLDDDKPGFFDSIDIAWRALTNGFFRNILCNGMIYILTGFLALLPNVLTLSFTDVTAPGLVFLGVACALIALALHLVISAFYSVNLGVIYFSGKADKRRFILNDPVK